MIYLWVALGSAIGGVLRYAIAHAMEPVSGGFPWGTVVVNIVGCFVIGYFGTLTLAGGRYAESPELRHGRDLRRLYYIFFVQPADV